VTPVAPSMEGNLMRKALLVTVLAAVAVTTAVVPGAAATTNGLKCGPCPADVPPIPGLECATTGS
jgi:hypothetical protein